MDRMQQRCGRFLSTDDDYDSASLSSLKACSDGSLDRSNEEGQKEKTTPSSEERTWMKNVYLANESIRLNHVLSTVESSEIKDILLARLHSADAKNLVALGILFPRAKYPYRTRPDCVHCQSALTTLCCAASAQSHPHRYVQKVKRGSDCSEFRCRLCNSTFRIPSPAPVAGDACSTFCDSCFKGIHGLATDAAPCTRLCKRMEETERMEFYV